MAHDTFMPALRALRERLKVLDDQRGRILTAIAAIEDLPAPEGGRPTHERDTGSSGGLTTEKSPSYAEAAASILADAGEPLHIDAILKKARGRGWYVDKDFADRTDRNSFLGGLDRNARKGRIFFKPEPATYGLIEWQAETDQQKNGTPAPDDAGAGADPNFWRDL